MDKPLAEAMINVDDMVVFLDDREHDDKLIELLSMYDPMGFYAERLLRKYLPKAEKNNTFTATLSREYILCRKLANLAFDKVLLERWVGLMLRLDHNPAQWLEAFLRRKLKRHFTPTEAQQALTIMIKNARDGSERLPDGRIVSSEPLETKRVVAFARDHHLDADDALKRIEQYYKQTRGNLY